MPDPMDEYLGLFERAKKKYRKALVMARASYDHERRMAWLDFKREREALRGDLHAARRRS